MKKKEICTVIRQKEIGDGIFSMWIQTENIGKEAKPGQFVSLYSKDGSKLLPRPISLFVRSTGKTADFVWCIVSRERRPEPKSFPD